MERVSTPFHWEHGTETSQLPLVVVPYGWREWYWTAQAIVKVRHYKTDGGKYKATISFKGNFSVYFCKSKRFESKNAALEVAAEIARVIMEAKHLRKGQGTLPASRFTVGLNRMLDLATERLRLRKMGENTEVYSTETELHLTVPA